MWCATWRTANSPQIMLSFNAVWRTAIGPNSAWVWWKLPYGLKLSPACTQLSVFQVIAVGFEFSINTLEIVSDFNMVKIGSDPGDFYLKLVLSQIFQLTSFDSIHGICHVCNFATYSGIADYIRVRMYKLWALGPNINYSGSLRPVDQAILNTRSWTKSSVCTIWCIRHASLTMLVREAWTAFCCPDWSMDPVEL